MTIDYSGDYRFWSQTEAVTVTLRRSGGDTEVSISTAYWEDVSRNTETLAGVRLEGDERICNIPVALLTAGGADRELQRDDTITDAGDVVWCILGATKVTVGSSASHWQAVCRKQR